MSRDTGRDTSWGRRPAPAVLVTPHAERAARDRLGSGVSLADALRAPLFRLPLPGRDLTLWGCLRPGGAPLLVLTDPADLAAPFLLVRTAGPWYFWHEARPLWVRAGVVQKRAGRWQVVPPPHRDAPQGYRETPRFVAHH